MIGVGRTPRTFCDCSKTVPIWNHFPVGSVLRDAPRSSAADFVRWAFEHSSHEDFLLLCTTLWAAWFLRNKETFTTEQCDPVQLTTQFHKQFADFNEYASSVHIPNRDVVLKYQTWCPPSAGWVKINFDAHIGAGLVRGLGVVVRDENGKLLVAGVRRVYANWSVEISEAVAAKFGVELVVRLGYQWVHLEGDSLSVVRAIENREAGLSHIHLVFDDIFRLSSSFDDFGCSFVRRNGNSLAHHVARWETGNASEKICMEPFPQSVLALANVD